ncbi:MAG: hypothetical protein ACE5HX_14275 [bacterium]
MSEQAELTNMKMVVQEPFEEYDVNRDFMSLDAWKKAREVKLFFYNMVLPEIPTEDKYI